MLRWHLQLGNLIIPKTSSVERLKENIDAFNFELDQEDMHAIAGLETGTRIGLNPDEF